MNTRSKVVTAASTLLTVLAIAFWLPAWAQEEKEKVLSGTVEIKSTQVAFIGSGQLGSGTLEFEGEEYSFSIGGLGIGGLGIARVTAVGAVYNLNDISKFPGTYGQLRAGATVAVGKGLISLENEHGVKMDLKFSSVGVALSVGADGMSVSMKE